MLREALQYLITPCAPVYRKMGYLKELIAIEARYRRTGKYWKQHQQKTSDYILRHIHGESKPERVVVLGAGLLLDIPFRELSRRCEQLVLVDVVFSRKVRSLARKHGNIYLLEHDVTGLANEMGRIKNAELPEPACSLPYDLGSKDYLLSINILSQLPLIPLKFAHRYIPDEAALDKWAGDIVRAHLDGLREQHTNVLLVTDIHHRLTNREGAVVEEYDCLFGNTLTGEEECWNWEYAPEGELIKGHTMDSLVCACHW